MERKDVESSTISTIGYDKSESTLEIEYKNGMIYQHFDVPRKTYKKLMKSSCVDHFLNTSIKNVYPYKSIS